MVCLPLSFSECAMPCCFGLADASPPHWPDIKSWKHTQYDKQRYFAACFPVLPVRSNPPWCFPWSNNATAWVCWLLDVAGRFLWPTCPFFPCQTNPLPPLPALRFSLCFQTKPHLQKDQSLSLSFAFVMMCFRQILLVLCFAVFHGIQFGMTLAFHMRLLSTCLPVWFGILMHVFRIRTLKMC